jgi:hypothetical protein
MRYWAYLAAKLAVAGVCLYGLLLLIGAAWPAPSKSAPASDSKAAAQAPASPAAPSPTVHVTLPEVSINLPDAVPPPPARPPIATTAPAEAAKPVSELNPLNDGISRLWFNLAMMGWFVLAAGAVYVIIWDQQHRCRTCLRRLRMPIQTGSWGRMLLLGRPRIESICPYGHGTLKEDELQISGRATPEWTPQSDNIWDELCASVIKEDEKNK